MPLQRRISVLVVAGLVVLFCLLGFVGILVVRDATQHTVEERLVITRLVASFFDARLADNRAKLEAFAAGLGRTLSAATADANDTTGADRDAAMGQVLADAPQLLEPFTERIVIVDRQWRVRAVVPGGDVDEALLPQLRALPTAQDALASGRTTVSGLVLGITAGPTNASDEASGHGMGGMGDMGDKHDTSGDDDVAAGQAAVVVAVPVRAGDSGRPVGLLLAIVRPGDPHLSSAVDVARLLGNTGHAELVDSAGMVLVATEPGHVSHLGEHPDFYVTSYRDGQPVVRTVPAVGPEHHAGERHVMAYVPLHEAPWGFALGGTEAETMAPTWRWIRLLVALGAVCVAAALFLVWLTTREVVNPIGALTRVAQRLAGGDLDAAVPVGGKDEVGQLAQNFEEMRRKLLTAHRALAIEKSRYEGIVQSMADAVFVADTSLRITSFNAAAERLTGWSAAEAIGRRCLDLFGNRDEHDCAVCGCACPLAAGRAAAQPLGAGPDASAVAGTPSEPTTERLTRRDGRTLVVATARSCIYGEGGVPVGVVHVVRDISAHEELRRLQDEFISTVSHELRTPLGFIKSYTTTLLRADTRWRPRTARRFLATIDQSADELAELIGNLLDMSRIRAGTLAIHPAPVRLHDVACAVSERNAPRLSAHHLAFDVPAELPPLQADARRIEQVLCNLLDNAAKYAPEGTITVQAALSAGGDAVVVRVSDEGPGIAAAERELVFERFYRGRDATVSRTAGSGLGLAICRGLVEAHGGRIWVDGAASRGATMAFTLPVGGPAAAEGPDAEVRGAPAESVRAVIEAPAAAPAAA